MSRFYVSKESIGDGTINVEGKEAHHIIDVMRMAAGDAVVVFDGTGKEYHGHIKTLGTRSLTIIVDAVTLTPSELPVSVTLIQALPKKDKMDYIVEKATELGVGSIVPVFTDRTIPDWDEKKCARQTERWAAIAMSAAKQSGRATIPSIHPVAQFTDYLKSVKTFDVALIAILNETTQPIKEALRSKHSGSVAIAIGPEGDFTPQEASAALGASFVPVSLGRRVLKSDTAGLMALSVIGYEYET